MTKAELLKRIEALEAEVAALKAKPDPFRPIGPPPYSPSWYPPPVEQPWYRRQISITPNTNRLQIWNGVKS